VTAERGEAFEVIWKVANGDVIRELLSLELAKFQAESFMLEHPERHFSLNERRNVHQALAAYYAREFEHGGVAEIYAMDGTISIVPMNSVVSVQVIDPQRNRPIEDEFRREPIGFRGRQAGESPSE
jgi:hypothetical protein